MLQRQTGIEFKQIVITLRPKQNAEEVTLSTTAFADHLPNGTKTKLCKN